eukprot:Gb_03849 [translate_table: standard]
MMMKGLSDSATLPLSQHPFKCFFTRLLGFSNHNYTCLFFLPSFLHPFSSKTAHGDSASSPPSIRPYIQQFLQKSCGLAQKPAILATKSLLRIKSTRNLELALQFFKERGFSNAQIQSMVTRYPKVLASSVHKTLQPKLSVFEEQGIVGADLAQVISRDPRLLTVSKDKKLKPGISFLKKMLESNENVLSVLRRHPWILRFHIEKKLKPNLLFLQSIGVDEKVLRNFFVTKPRFLVYGEALIKDAVNTVDKVGVPRHSRMFPHAICVVCSMNKKTLEHKIKFLISLGLSEEEVLMAFRKSPYILAISEQNLQNHMNFVVNTLKYEPSVIVVHPRYFMTSMEATVTPRYRVLQKLQSMQLPKDSFSVINMFSMSEKRFLEKFVARYGEASGLYEIYKGVDGTKPCSHMIDKEG